MTDPLLPPCIKSCTGNSFNPPEDYLISGRGGNLYVSFFADDQDCVHWGMVFPHEPSKYAPVVAGGLDFWTCPDEPDRHKEAWAPFMAASQLEAFLYRYWIENEIWFASVWDETKRELTSTEQEYVAHLYRVYGDDG